MKVLVVGKSINETYFLLDGFPKETGKYRVKNKINCLGGSAFVMFSLLDKWKVDANLSSKIDSEHLSKLDINKDYITEGPLQDKYIIINRYNSLDTILYEKNEEFYEKRIYDIKPDIILIDSEYYRLADDAITAFPKTTVILNLNDINENAFKLCKVSDYIICSKETAEVLSKERIDYLKPESLKKVIKYISDLYSTEVIITLGEKGCLYMVDDKIKIMGAIKTIVKDSSSARDIFAGAFTYGISKKLPLEKCLKIATIASGLSVKNVAHHIPEVKEVYKIYEKNR